MTLEVSSHHIIELIKEDIKLNHLIFGLQDLGLECQGDLLNLSLVIFKICKIDIDEDYRTIEKYYVAINDLRKHPIEKVSDRLDEFSNDLLKQLIGE
ncbi:MAG: hypothetical protein ABJP45_14970 [Cyclobacteriaceae bacterium]